MNYIQLGDVIATAKVNRCGENDFPVLSITKSDGIVLQSEKFKKRIASKDTADYKVVHRGQLVQGIHIDEANFGIQEVVDIGIVSPAYKIWNIKSNMIVPKYLEIVLRSPRSIAYYASKFNGSIKRRERLSDKDFLQMRIPCPAVEEQIYAIEVLDKAAELIGQRRQQLIELDNLIKARFVEMFGDPESNPMNWNQDKADNHIDLLSGFPFDSSKYTERGINICGGLIIMPQRIDWQNCKYWCSVDGYEDYTLQENDIVIALDRPWISEGFKIAMVDAGHLPALLIQRTARIRATDINQHYLMYCFLIGGFDKHCSVTGSLVPHISAKDIRSYMIMLPPLPLQEEFAALVKQVDKSKVVVQKALLKHEKYFWYDT